MRRAKQIAPRLALVILLIAGTLVRAWYAQRAVVFESDRNTVPLMALHIARGEDFPLYFYGQHYMGGVGPYVIAGVFLIAGPSDMAVSIGMLPFTWVWMFALYLLFGRLISRWAGAIAAGVVALGPPTLVGMSVEPWIGYVPTFAYGALILYFGVRLNDADLSPRGERWCLIGMGALAGLAIWTNPLCLPYLIVGFGLLVRHLLRSGFRRMHVGALALGVVALLVTASPVIITWVRHGLGALFGFRPSSVSEIPKTLDMTFTRYVPETFGFDGLPIPFAVLGVLICAGLLGLVLLGFAVAAIRRHRTVVRAALVPLLFVVVFLPFYLTNPLAAKYNPRYFLTFFPLVVTAFVFPLALRRAWLTWTAIGSLALISVGHLAASVHDGTGQRADRIAKRRAARARLVQAVEEHGLRHVMDDSEDWHALTWVARDRVAFVKPWGERYYPYLLGAIADDNAGFMFDKNSAEGFRTTLECLGISWVEFSESGQMVFHNLALPNGGFQQVPVLAVHVQPGDFRFVDRVLSLEPAPFLDRDEETLLGAQYSEAQHIFLDLGGEKRVTGLRFVAPHERDFPTGYAIHVSVDGVHWWLVQRVEQRVGAACIYGDRVFCRGPDTAMECRFEPTTARYLVLDDLRAPAENVDTWRFSEVFIYAAAGEQKRPDDQDVAEIIRRLDECGADFAFADPWLSAKLELRDGGPDVLPYYSPRGPETHVPHTVPVRAGVAIVVERAHAADAERLLRNVTLDDIELHTFETADYVSYVIARAPDGFASFPGLRWCGFTLVHTARVATAAWYHGHGVELSRLGKVEQARESFERSFDTYPGIDANLRVLAVDNAKARAMFDRLTPAVEARCRFPYGISLVGYTLTPSTPAPGETAMLTLVWELEGSIPYDYLPVFVHFTGGNTIRFQADHDVRFPLLPRSTVPRCRVLDEHTFTVPADCPAGTLELRLGALTWWDRTRRLRPHTRLRSHARAVELGTVIVTSD
ncbi:MAG: hypothetical protein JW889_05245 [Verrucomicrobia bacterium]|nr:hypothetical protein [Verrucomicrobiota bacterium]